MGRIVTLGLAAAVGVAAPAGADGVRERVSVGPGGVQADGSSFSPSISADGRFVAFSSDATNLVPGRHQRGTRRVS
jgi:hypothetical protein